MRRRLGHLAASRRRPLQPTAPPPADLSRYYPVFFWEIDMPAMRAHALHATTASAKPHRPSRSGRREPVGRWLFPNRAEPL
jgi:hypothetical protein